ncbi:hypothetical protein VTN96DRAFT_2537 [Rasamsonia emersonii]
MPLQTPTSPRLATIVWTRRACNIVFSIYLLPAAERALRVHDWPFALAFPSLPGNVAYQTSRAIAMAHGSRAPKSLCLLHGLDTRDPALAIFGALIPRSRVRPHVTTTSAKPGPCCSIPCSRHPLQIIASPSFRLLSPSIGPVVVRNLLLSRHSDLPRRPGDASSGLRIRL